MAGFNKIILVGYLTRDPEFRVLPSGTAVVKIGLASTRRFNSRDGEKKEQTCFVDVKFFGRQAEIINEYMSKGRMLLVEGRLDYSTWTSQDGGKRSKHEVIGESFQFLNSGRQTDRSDQRPRDDYSNRDTSPRDNSNYQPPPSNYQQPQNDGQQAAGGEGGLDEVPF